MPRATDDEIVDFFEKNQGELNQERSDFLLPQIVDFVQQEQWVNIRPEYQRRQVWGLPRSLLKFSGDSVHDYATICAESPRPSLASRARSATTSCSTPV